jgi:hypothetical protein
VKRKNVEIATQFDDTKTPRPTSGSFVVKDVSWGFARRDDGTFELWSHHDEVGVPDVAAASRYLRTHDPARPSAIRLRTVPAPAEVLGEPMTWNALRPAYDNALKDALRILGTDARDWDTGGMPSDYRGWLMTARDIAIRSMRRMDTNGLPASGTYEHEELAAEIVMGTCSVAFSMRYTKATLEFTMAVALAGLRGRL